MKLVPNDSDDLWVISNVVQTGDRVYTRSSREINITSEGSRPTEGKRIPMFLGVQVEKAFFQRMSDKLRISGIIIDAPEKYALKGSHHSIAVAIGKQLTLVKDEWSRHDLEMIERASKWKTTPILIIALDDETCGLAQLTQNTLEIVTEIKGNLPKKREAEKRTVAIQKYFRDILRVMTTTIDRSQSFISIVGPGFLKASFAKFLREQHPGLFKRVAVVGLTSNGGIGGVHEAIRSGVLDRVTKKVRIVEETKVVGEVLHRLGSGKRNVSYGLESVKKAVEYGAVGVLLISSKLLRETSTYERQNLEQLMRSAENMGGKIMIIGNTHEAGVELLGLGGIAASLRYEIDTL